MMIMARRQVRRPAVNSDAPFEKHPPEARRALQDAHRHHTESTKETKHNAATDVIAPEAREALQRAIDTKIKSNKI